MASGTGRLITWRSMIWEMSDGAVTFSVSRNSWCTVTHVRVVPKFNGRAKGGDFILI